MGNNDQNKSNKIGKSIRGAFKSLDLFGGTVGF